jgi:hypothetical protein
MDTPVTVSVVGTGEAPPTGTIAQTPAGMADVRLKVIKPIVAVGVRALHVFLITFFGALGSSAVGATPADWTWHTALMVAAGAAFLETGKNAITILGKLENENPPLTGSI